MESDYIKISDYAKRMSVGIRKVYRDYHKGSIEGFQEKETGTIRLKNPFITKSITDKKSKISAVLYARVPSSQNKNNLDTQLERLKSYAFAKGFNVVDEIKEIGSGLNDNRPKLINLFNRLNTFDVLIVEHKDRLTRFGFRYIEALLKNCEKSLIVINEAESDKEDLIQDFVSVITSFCARVYAKERQKK